MLVIVHYGNLAFLLESGLDLETLGGLDILKIDSSERGFKSLHNLDHLVGILFIDFDVKCIDPGENLEKQCFPLHHRFPRKCSDITQTEHCRSVGNHSDKIATVGIAVSVRRILFYLKTGKSHTGRISKRKVLLCNVRFGGKYCCLSRLRILMILQCFSF